MTNFDNVRFYKTSDHTGISYKYSEIHKDLACGDRLNQHCVIIIIIEIQPHFQRKH